MQKRLVDKIESKEAIIGIIGLGYVGLPLMIRFIEVGYRVFGFDVDKEKVTRLNSGDSYIKHICPSKIKECLEKGFEATEDFSKIEEVDAIIICVPTPLNKYREPDLSYVLNTTESILPYIKKGQIISLESTTYPGTTEEELLPRIEGKNLKVGEDIYLVFSPEREDPGNQNFTTQIR